MTSIVLSSASKITRALLVALALFATAVPAFAAEPQARDSSMTVRNGRTTLTYLRATGDQGTVLTYEIIAQGNKGTASLVTGNRPGSVSYTVTPGVNPVGTDQFTFRVIDSNSRSSNTATVTITFVNKTVITWPLPRPITYGTALTTTAIATAGGVPVAGTFTYTPDLGTVLNVGTTLVTASFSPADGGASVSRSLNLRVKAAPITVTSSASRTYGAANPVLTPIYSGFVNGDTAANVLSGAPNLSTTAKADSNVGTYPITVRRGTLTATSNYSLRHEAGLLTVTPATATIMLSDLHQVYDGLGHEVLVSTIPEGLATQVTYDNTTSLPVDSGSYPIVATITDPNYLGSTTETLTIAKAPVELTISDLTHVYDGGSHTANVTAPYGLKTIVTYNNSTTEPINAGSYAVIATIDDSNYAGMANGILEIAKATADITLENLIHMYDGNSHEATVSTFPAPLSVSLTYNGETSLPHGAGTYAVVATVVDENYQGSVNEILIVEQATQNITLSPLVDVMFGGPDQVLSATATSGLPVDFTVSGPALISGNLLQVTGPGQITVTATQAGDTNWGPATPATQTITASPAGGLLASYFANKTLGGTPVLSRTDSEVNFDWASGSPAAGVVPADQFSVRWYGAIIPRFNETYTLTFRTDDGVRVWFDGQLIVDRWNDRSAADSSVVFSAVAGRPYRIRMEYYENGGLAVAKILWRSASEPSGPIPSSQLLPTPPDASGPIGTGTGLTGSYFANETLSGVPAVSRIDNEVNFNWAGGSPASGIPTDSFSARWSGDIQPRYTEPYTLTLRTDDGVRLWLDGELVINDWFLRGAANSTYTFNAEAGRRYRIHIEYYEHFGSAVAQLQWHSEREFSGPVPATQLYELPVPEVVVADVAITLAEGESANLSATVSGTDGVSMAYAWTQEDGPALVSFSEPSATSTKVRFPSAGIYVLKCAAFNGHVTVSDTTTVTVAESDVTSDLVAHYTFDESTGNLAYDSSGKQHTGTVINASRTTGKSSGALRFDGTSYVFASANEDLDLPLPALTLAVWLKPDRTLAEMAHPWPMAIYRASYETSSGYALMTTITESDYFGLRLHHQAGFGERIESATASPFVPGEWIHVAGVFDGSHATLYRDGIAVGSMPTGAISVRSAANSPLVLGYGFEGLMDDVRIYHRALSRTDVYGLAQDGSNRRVPGVNAGIDQVLALPASTVFAASATDDAGSGLPLIATWKQIGGPAAAVIADYHSLTSPVDFTAAGSYHFLLEVSDGVLTGRDEVRIEVTNGTVDLVTGLILYHPCDEGAGTTLNDASNHGHLGEFLYGAQWSQDGQPLSAVQLTGNNVIFTQSSSAIDQLEQMTLALWIRIERPLVDMAHPFPLAIYHADYENSGGFALMTTQSDTNLFGLRLHTGTGLREVVMDGLPSGQWVHVAATYDGEAMRLYRNGELVGLNVTGPISVPSFSGPLNIGGGFEGLFDEIRIYNRALSPTEVQALHALVPIGGSG